MFRPLCFAFLLLAACGMAAAAEPLLPQAKAYATPDAWRQPVAPVRNAAHTMQKGPPRLTALQVNTN